MSKAVRVEAGGADLDAVLTRARDLGVLGWVRDDEGVVRVHAEGPAEAVDELAAFVGGDAQTVKVEGHEQFAVRGVPAGAFAVREHDGVYELHLEVAGGVRA